MDTFMPSGKEIERKWYVVDATDMTLGRLASEAAKVLTSRTGVAQIPAVINGNVYAVYHQFYNHPYNIVGMEYLAKFIYPQEFKTLDPAKTYRDIVRNYTNLPDQDFILGWSAKK